MCNWIIGNRTFQRFGKRANRRLIKPVTDSGKSVTLIDGKRIGYENERMDEKNEKMYPVLENLCLLFLPGCIIVK